MKTSNFKNTIKFLRTPVLGAMAILFLAQCGAEPEGPQYNIDFDYSPTEPIVIPTDITLPDDTVLSGPWTRFALKASNNNDAITTQQWAVLLAIIFKVTDTDTGVELEGAIDASQFDCGGSPCPFLMALGPGENEANASNVFGQLFAITGLPEGNGSNFRYLVEVEVVGYTSDVTNCVSGGTLDCTTAAGKATYAFLNPEERVSGRFNFTTR